MASTSAFAQALRSDLAITKTVNGATVSTALPGDSFTYTIVVTNIGPDPSDSLQMEDQLPSGLTLVNFTSTTPSSYICGSPAPDMVECSGGPLIPGASYTVTLDVELSPSIEPGSTRINEATVTNGSGGSASGVAGGEQPQRFPEVNFTNNAAQHQLQVVGPDLSIEKTHTGNGVRGQQLTYTLAVSNLGPLATNGSTTVTDTLPAGLTAVSFSGAGWTCTTTPLQCTRPPGAAVGALPPLSLVVAVAGNAAASLTNVATVTTSGDGNAANNTASDQTAVVSTADLAITKTGTASANPGDNVTYQINVSNLGGVTSAAPWTMTDVLPVGMTFVSVSAPAGAQCFAVPAVGANGTVTCGFPDLAPGATIGPVTLVARLSDTASGTVTNTATIAPSSPDANLANNSASFSTDVLGAPAVTSLSLGLSFSSPTYYAAGQVIEVRYLVTNTSETTVNTVAVTDAKVPVIACPATTLAPGTAMTCAGPYTTTAADITAGVSAFTATVTGSGGATATASGSIASTTGAVQAAFNQLTPMPVMVNPPGLHDRIGASSASLSESNGEPTLNFSASFLAGASKAAAALAGGEARLPFKVWIDGTLTLHTQDIGHGVSGIVGLGGDYLINADLLVGAALYVDMMSRTLKAGTLKGRGFVVGPYVSAAVTPNITIDAGIFAGASSQDAAATVNGVAFTGSYTTQRVIARAKLDGLWEMGAFTVRPDATFYLSHETAGAYTVRDTLGNTVAIAGFTSVYLDLSGGTVVQRPVDLENGLVLIPYAGARIGVGGQGASVSLNDPYGSASAGLILEGAHWRVQTSVEGSLFASSLKTLRYKAGISGEF